MMSHMLHGGLRQMALATTAADKTSGTTSANPPKSLAKTALAAPELRRALNCRFARPKDDHRGQEAVMAQQGDVQQQLGDE
ncbi:hypothetical protein PgNI_10971 [Pyricularia grisea]|uniref:Uncharacterized protein n=1 Tax=Pyricularia grisea TaxID=148305 RepID=A0A6P8AYR7_PYRGI|nr:hypothetical protein PgNI_10971 [Pyricularia grisea]TLD07487.1 hypothetical protein PgNI_10971 [Pyricularia grisea]